MARSAGPVVVALIAAYNEADIIGEVVRALVDEGVRVYFIDNHSTDGTLAEVGRFRDRGVIGVETFPPAAGGRPPAATFEWGRILARKEELSRTLDADWFIHHDADEFRESPWDGVTLQDGIARADAAGYNAIDFHVLDFRPTTADPPGGTDVRARLQFYEPAHEFDRLQVKCWKKTDQPVVLTATGGHSAEFSGRRVFPVRFLLRHYPIRSQAHGTRKVFEERLPRFAPAERAQGWHVQYDTVDRATAFVRDPAELVRYDANAVRLDLWLRHRGVEALERDLASSRAAADAHQAKTTELEFLRHAHSLFEQAVRDLVRDTETLEEQLRAAAAAAAGAQNERQELTRTIDALTHERHILDRGLHVQHTTVARLQEQLARIEAESQQLRSEIESLRAKAGAG